MFMGLPTVLSFLALSTNATAPDEVQLCDGMAVTIEISGDVAKDYVRLAKSQRLAESFQSHGTLLIDGVVRSTSEDSVELQHKVIVAEIGEPVRRAMFAVTIDRDDINPDVLKMPAEKNAPAIPQIQLPNHVQFRIRSTHSLETFRNVRERSDASNSWSISQRRSIDRRPDRATRVPALQKRRNSLRSVLPTKSATAPEGSMGNCN